MYNNTTDGSFDNEAVKIANAFKPFWKKWMKEWGRNCVRSKKMTVTTAPSILTGLIGVTDAFSDTECMIPFQNKVANAQVGDTVWVKWMYDNQQTMYAENMGDVRSEKVIISGVKNAEPVPSGGSVSYSISFEKPFKDTPVVVASMISPHSIETGLCSVRIWDVSPFSFTVGYQNGSQYSRHIGASWIATGELLNNPIQYITDTTPYLNRAIPYSSNYLNLNKIIGGTVCWNQLLQKLETGKWSVSGADSYTLLERFTKTARRQGNVILALDQAIDKRPCLVTNICSRIRFKQRTADSTYFLHPQRLMELLGIKHSRKGRKHRISGIAQ